MKNEQNLNLGEETTTIEKQNTNTLKPASKQKKSGYWKCILVGGAPGIILGTAGTAFAHEAADTDTQDAENVTETGSFVGTDTVNVQSIDTPISETVSDDMDFSDAFDAARAEVGPGGIFQWHGNIYSTCTTDEWNSMSDEDRQAFAESAARHSHADDSQIEEPQEEELQDGESQDEEPQKEDLQDVPENENIVAEEAEENVIESKLEIPDVQGIETPGAQTLAAEHIEIVNVAIATDNQDAELADVNNEGYVDGVVVAANDNNPIQENEAIETPESSVTTSDLALMSDNTEDSLYQDLPDYTNDADTSSLA